MLWKTARVLERVSVTLSLRPTWCLIIRTIDIQQQFPESRHASVPNLENADLGFLILAEKNIYQDSIQKHGKVRIGDIDTLIQADTANLDVFGSTSELSLPVYTETSFSYCRMYNNPKLFDQKVYVFCSTIFDRKNLYIYLHAEPTCVYQSHKFIFMGFKNGTIGCLSVDQSIDDEAFTSPVFEYMNRVLSEKDRSARLKNILSIFNQENSMKYGICDIVFHNDCLYSIDEKKRIICWRIKGGVNGRNELIKAAEFSLPTVGSHGIKSIKFFKSLQLSDSLLVSCGDMFFEVADLSKSIGVVCYGRNDIPPASISTILVSDIGVFIVGYENGTIRLYLRGNQNYVNELPTQAKSKIQTMIPAFYATPSKNQKPLNISEGLNFIGVLMDDLQISILELDDQSSYQFKTKINVVDELEKSISNIDTSKVQATFTIWAFRSVQ